MPRFPRGLHGRVKTVKGKFAPCFQKQSRGEFQRSDRVVPYTARCLQGRRKSWGLNPGGGFAKT